VLALPAGSGLSRRAGSPQGRFQNNGQNIYDRRHSISQDSSKLFETRSLSEKVDHMAPDGSEIRLLAQANRGGLAHCTLPVGKTSSAVAHKTVEEIWFFTAGHGQVWRKLNDVETVVDVHPSINLAIPAGASFQFRNIGKVPLEFIITTMPPWPGSQEASSVPSCWEPDTGTK
jgi:mannose-6-phosphate isomerase-like protein (cupin superfamily)